METAEVVGIIALVVVVAYYAIKFGVVGAIVSAVAEIFDALS